MNIKTLFFNTKKTGFGLGVVLLVALAKCTGNANGQSAAAGAGINVTPPVTVSPAVVQDVYDYYPNYGIYYNRSRRQYVYLQEGGWVSTPAPQGVLAVVLLASPSVTMDFHDSPEKHNAEMVRKYPKNWAPPGSDHNQK